MWAGPSETSHINRGLLSPILCYHSLDPLRPFFSRWPMARRHGSRAPAAAHLHRCRAPPASHLSLLSSSPPYFSSISFFLAAWSYRCRLSAYRTAVLFCQRRCAAALPARRRSTEPQRTAPSAPPLFSSPHPLSVPLSFFSLSVFPSLRFFSSHQQLELKYERESVVRVERFKKRGGCCISCRDRVRER